MKTTFFLATVVALVLAPPAYAQEQTRTKTFDGENVSATTTTTVNPEAGTVSRDREAVNTNNGKTYSSEFDRQKTDTGAVISGSQTGPQGNTRSFEGERTRADNGSTFTGTATGRNGETFGLSGSRARDGQGNSSANQNVTNSSGTTVFNRDRTTTRSQGSVDHNVSRQRDPNFKPRRARTKAPR
jgi:hypothetical protein